MCLWRGKFLMCTSGADENALLPVLISSLQEL